MDRISFHFNDGSFIVNLGIIRTDIDFEVPSFLTSVTRTDQTPGPSASGFLSNVSFGADSILLESVSGSTILYDSFIARFDYTAAPIPEPATITMFAFGLVGLGFMRRRVAEPTRPAERGRVCGVG